MMASQTHPKHRQLKAAPKHRIALLLVLAAAMASIAVSCTRPAQPLEPTPTATRGPVTAPAVLRIGMPEDLTTTNIWAMLGPDSTAWNFYALLNRYPTLYGLSDVRFDFVPVVANGLPSELEQEGDLWTSTVKLKEGVR